MHKRRLWFHQKNVKIGLSALLVLIVLLAVFRVPTRVSVLSLNRNTNLPVSLLMRSRDADFYDFTVEHGFGMISYLKTDANGGDFRVDVSMWPDAIFGKQRIDYVSWNSENYSVYGFSVGDELAKAEMLLRRHGFVKTANSDEYRLQHRKFGLVITCTPDPQSGTIQSISVSIEGTNIFGIVY